MTTKPDVPKSEAEIEAAEAQIVELSKRIDFFLTEYSVEILADKMRAEEYSVPAYQREFTWEPERRSKFIESLLLGLPIPFLFFWEMPDGRLEIVDGSQRLRTIEDFVLGDFRLGELDQLTHLTGFRFCDLPESRRRKVRNRSIRGIVLNEHADKSARFDMFERINTGSKIAGPAEVRRGALAGPFLELVIKLAQDPVFERLTPMSTTLERQRGREELVSRFFAFSDGLVGYRDRPKDFVFSYSKTMNDRMANESGLRDQYVERFDRMNRFVERVFPNGFAKAAKSKATPRARFEAIAVGSALALRRNPGLFDLSPDVAWVDETEFREITGSDSANVVKKLSGRIDYVVEKLLA